MTQLFSFLAIGLALAADVAVPPLVSHVNDLTATLSVEQVQELDRSLAAFEKKKGSQVVVLLVPTTQPETIEQYAIRVAESWKLGRKSIDDGAILVLAKQDRKLRIEVGNGLEGVLPDATTKHIIDEAIVPHLRVGDFYGGVRAGIDAITGAIEGEALPPPVSRDWSGGNLPPLHFLLLGFFLVTAVGIWLRARLGRLPAALLIGGMAIVLLKLLVTGIVLACAGGLLVFLFTLLGGLGTLGQGTFRGSRWGGGGFSGGGGFGGGGFRGGGGGFGGGGASGSW